MPSIRLPISAYTIARMDELQSSLEPEWPAGGIMNVQ